MKQPGYWKALQFFLLCLCMSTVYAGEAPYYGPFPDYIVPWEQALQVAAAAKVMADKGKLMHNVDYAESAALHRKAADLYRQASALMRTAQTRFIQASSFYPYPPEKYYFFQRAGKANYLANSYRNAVWSNDKRAYHLEKLNREKASS